MLTERSLNFSRSRRPVGLPQLGESQHQQPSPEDSADAGPSPATPYRLPKLQPPAAPAQRGQPAAGGDVVYTRYGRFSPRSHRSSSPDFADNDQRPPRTNRSVFPGPSFSQAVVTPVWSPLMSRQLLRSDSGVQNANDEFGKRFRGQRSKTSCTILFSAFGSSVHRGPSAAGGWQQQQQQQPLLAQKSDAQGSFSTVEKPVHWVMRPLRRFQVDRKGQQLNQGPFSRELVVHARPPQSWLRMKLGGSSNRLPAP